jgi:hypothetical protein
MQSDVVEILPDNTIVKYTLQSRVTLEYIDACTRIFKLTIEDISSSTDDPSNLFTGIMVGDCQFLAGQVGYQGIAKIVDGNIFEFAEPGGENETAFWQRGVLTPCC